MEVHASPIARTSKPTRTLVPCALLAVTALAGWGIGAIAAENDPTDAAPLIEPGASDIRTKRLDAYQTTTRWGSQRLIPGKLDGRKTWHLINSVDAGDSPMIDHIVLDRRTLELVNRHSPYFAIGQHFLAAAIRDRRLTGSLTAIDGGDPIVINTELDTAVFEESTLGLVLAALPLRNGYAARLPRLAVSASTKAFSAGSIAIAVTGREAIEGGDGQTYRCWVVEARWSGVDYSETHWIADEPPYSIRKKARFPDGRERESGFVSVTRGK